MMIWSSWREWFFEPNAVQIVLKFIFAMVLAITPANLCSGKKFSSWVGSEPIGLACLSMTALILTLATQHPIGAGAICLLLDTWRKRHLSNAHPLDAGFSIWAIALGLLLAEGQFVIAFFGTMIPSIALWVFITFSQSLTHQGHLLIRFTADSEQDLSPALFENIQTQLDHPLKQVYQHEYQGRTTFGMATTGKLNELQELETTLRIIVPQQIRLEFEPLPNSARVQGGLA